MVKKLPMDQGQISKPVFLTAEWRKLALANYRIDPRLLNRYLPYKTELDLWEGKCLVSLVGFRFLNTKIRGVPVPFHRDFEEVNLRFYVRFKDSGEWKRGVVFIKEIVPKRALSLVANKLYGEKYVSMPMKHSWVLKESSLSVSYSWKHKNQWDGFSVLAEASPGEIVPGSNEEFITEHYWGYTCLDGQCSSEYAVEHPKWEVYPVKKANIKVRFGDLYGDEFEFLNSQEPDSVMLAEGSRIKVRSATRIT